MLRDVVDEIGYIYVGDGCWRRDVLVTILSCWWRVLAISVTNILYFLTLTLGTSIKKMSRSLFVSHQHDCGIYCLHSMRKIRFIIYLSYFVQPFRKGILLFVWISQFDPQSRSVFDENISFPLQLDGRISIDKLKLQSETSPESHWIPMELGRQILNLSTEFKHILNGGASFRW